MNEALVLLVLVWAAVLVMGAVRARNASPHATVGGFERAMEVLRNEAGGVSHPPGTVVSGAGGWDRGDSSSAFDPATTWRSSEDPVVARRRSWFLRALAVTGVTFVVALIGGGRLWLVFLVSVLLTAGYATVLRHLKLQRDEARRVVRDLELRRAPRAEHGVATQADAVGFGTGAYAAAPMVYEDGVAWESSSVRLRRWDD